MTRARFLTLNLWGDRAPLAARLEAAAAGIAALQPDVIMLQEVRAGDGLTNTAADLAARLGADVGASYACATSGGPGVWGPGSAAGEEGLAILSAHPVSQVVKHVLPEARADETRILLSARVDIRGVPVFVHTTHLHYRLGDGVAREQQVLAIDELARNAGEGIHVIGGDFNAAPDTDEIRFMAGKHTLAGRRAVWQDAAPPAPGFTWARRNPNTAWLAWLALDRRIDYLFVSPERPKGVARVLDARVALDAPHETGVYASDHFALWADVQLA